MLSNDELAARALNPPAENDIYPLVVLSAALSNGVTSRLYQALVETELAVAADARVDQFRDPGLFNVNATVSPGVEPQRVEDAIHAELRRVADEGLDEAEVEKAKRQIVAQTAYDRDGTHNVAMQMSEAEAVADWRFFKDYAANVSRVTAEDVRRVARKYFTRGHAHRRPLRPEAAGRERRERDARGGVEGCSRRRREERARDAPLEVLPRPRRRRRGGRRRGDALVGRRRGGGRAERTRRRAHRQTRSRRR